VFLLAVTWTMLPTALLLLGDRLVTPMYDVRYPTFCVPAVALLMASGVRELARLARHGGVARAITTGVIVAMLAGLSMPTFLAQRQPYAKDGGSDLRQSANLLGSLASPGDAVVFDQSVKPSRRPRLAKALYPASFAGLADVALTTPYAQRTRLWDRVAPLTEVEASLAHHRVVWAVELSGSASSDVSVLESLGYDVTAVHPIHRTNVVELVRQ
jgi:mannosyltransferase